MSVLEAQSPASSAVLRIQYGATISSVDDLIHPPPTATLVTPGFIDLQVNGFAGVDYNDPSSSHDAIRRSIQRIFETGVTRFLPTVITGPESRIVGALRNLARFVQEGGTEAQAIAGFHVEGPHICPDDGPRGAHPKANVRPPDTSEFDRWQEAADGMVRIVTVSPEWPGTPSYIEHVTRQGVVVSVGHTKATSEQIQAAVVAGATMSTHLGNGGHPSLPKVDNYIWDQLAESRLTAGFIVDGIHIPRAFITAALRAKGVERSFLVSDAVMPAMCEPGFYRLGEMEVELHPGGEKVTLRGARGLAGSVLRMDMAIGNVVRLGGVSLVEALSMATITPARAARIAGRQRGLNTGEKADFVTFEWDVEKSRLSVLRTVLAGQDVFVRSAS